MLKSSPHLIALTAALAGSVALAQPSPVGLWRTIDDDSGKEKSLVRISEAEGTLSGHIEKIVDPTKQDAKCIECSDERKNQPLIGLQILRNVRKGEQHWEGGDILDPNNGKVYRVRLTLEDEGKKLQVRGYIGTPMLGRTQTWQRVE